MDGGVNYRKEKRNVEILQRKKRKKPRGFIWPQDIGRSGRYLEKKKLASRLNNGKIWDFYSLQSSSLRGRRFPLFPFLPIPYPLPLSTPATQAIRAAMGYQNGRITTSFTSFNLDKRLTIKILIISCTKYKLSHWWSLLLYGNIRLAIRIVTLIC